jgi:hypothetical protein
MTTDRDFDRLARAWLELLPDEAPDRAVDAVLQAVETTPQVRRPWRWLTWRSTTMNRLPLALAATVVVAVAGTLLLARSGPPGPAASTPSPGQSSAPSASSIAAGGPLPTEIQGRWMGDHRPPADGDAGTTILITDTAVALAQANTGNRPLITSSASAAGTGRFRLEATAAIGSCPAGSVGLYDWTRSADGLTLTISPASDGCAARAAAFEGDWSRMGCKDPQNYCLGELAADMHSSQFIAPRLDDPDVGWKAQYGALWYRVPLGWANSADWPGTYELMPAAVYARTPDEEADRSIGFATQPSPISKDAACESVAPAGRGRTVEDLIAWLDEVPGLITTAPEPITIGTYAGQQVDLRIDPAFTSGCHVDGKALVEYQTSMYSGLLGTERHRLIYLDLGDGDVFSITIRSTDPEAFGVFAAEAMTIVETVGFE